MTAKKTIEIPTVTVIARANVLDLSWGDEAVVPANDYVEMLIGAGKLQLVDNLPEEESAPAPKKARATKPDAEHHEKNDESDG